MKYVSMYKVFFCSIFISVAEVNGLVFSDITNMEDLIDMQSLVIDYFQSKMQFIQNEISKQTAIEFVARLQVEHEKAMRNVTHYLSNPINAYRLVKRLYLDLDFTEKVADLRFLGADHEQGIKLFTNRTLILTGAAMVNLIAHYNLSVEDISNGTLKIKRSLFYPEAQDDDFFIENVTPLLSTDCYMLAVQTANEKLHATAHKWMDEARRKFDSDCTIRCPVSMSDYLDFQKLLSFGSDHTNDQLLNNQLGDFNPLCNKMHYQKSLTCQYRYGPHPFLRLARIKTETVYNDPDVTMFHDAISDEEIAIIETLSRERFKTAGTECQVMSQTATDRKCDETPRINQVSLVLDNNYLRKLSIRVLDMSGRMGVLTEPWQVSLYGPGGYYKQHYDAGYSWSQFRSSTIIFYISDVQFGGATTFNKLGIGINPKKYSAIYWHNVIPSKGFDSRTVHASCPLLFGFKMVAIKWLTEMTDSCPIERTPQVQHQENENIPQTSLPLFRLSYNIEDSEILYLSLSV